MRNIRAFTLLEVMVVLAIIGGLMAMVTLTSSDRQAQDETEEFARKLLAVFSTCRQESVFQNIDLGMAMDDQSMLLLSYQDINSQEFTANKTREELDLLAKNPWQPYSGPINSEIEAPEYIYMALEAEGEEIDFSELLDDEDGPKPALLFLSSDEYTPFKITLLHEQDDRFRITLEGDGFNEPLMSVERFDE